MINTRKDVNRRGARSNLAEVLPDTEDARAISRGIQSASRKNDLPPIAEAILYTIADIESNFRARVSGPTINEEVSGDPRYTGQNASGAFQFMPDVARQYGIDPNNPSQAADGAAKLLLDNYESIRRANPNMSEDQVWLAAGLAHHSGAGNVINNTLGPNGKQYQALLQERIQKYLGKGQVSKPISQTTPQDVADDAANAEDIDDINTQRIEDTKDYDPIAEASALLEKQDLTSDEAELFKAHTFEAITKIKTDPDSATEENIALADRLVQRLKAINLESKAGPTQTAVSNLRTLGSGEDLDIDAQAANLTVAVSGLIDGVTPQGLTDLPKEVAAVIEAAQKLGNISDQARTIAGDKLGIGSGNKKGLLGYRNSILSKIGAVKQGRPVLLFRRLQDIDKELNKLAEFVEGQDADKVSGQKFQNNPRLQEQVEQEQEVLENGLDALIQLRNAYAELHNKQQSQGIYRREEGKEKPTSWQGARQSPDYQVPVTTDKEFYLDRRNFYSPKQIKDLLTNKKSKYEPKSNITLDDLKEYSETEEGQVGKAYRGIVQTTLPKRAEPALNAPTSEIRPQQVSEGFLRPLETTSTTRTPQRVGPAPSTPTSQTTSQQAPEGSPQPLETPSATRTPPEPESPQRGAQRLTDNAEIITQDQEDPEAMKRARKVYKKTRDLDYKKASKKELEDVLKEINNINIDTISEKAKKLLDAEGRKIKEELTLRKKEEKQKPSQQETSTTPVLEPIEETKEETLYNLTADSLNRYINDPTVSVEFVDNVWIVEGEVGDKFSPAKTEGALEGLIITDGDTTYVSRNTKLWDKVYKDAFWFKDPAELQLVIHPHHDKNKYRDVAPIAKKAINSSEELVEFLVAHEGGHQSIGEKPNDQSWGDYITEVNNAALNAMGKSEYRELPIDDVITDSEEIFVDSLFDINGFIEDGKLAGSGPMAERVTTLWNGIKTKILKKRGDKPKSVLGCKLF